MKSQKEEKKQRKVFVLQWGGDNFNNLDKLNTDLGYGWAIENITPMGTASTQGAPIGYCAFCLVRE